MDRHTFLPKYYRISKEIIKKIETGDLPPGSKILSENKIIKLYKVSNTTARKVLQAIENEGWVTRIKGKGTYVRSANIVNRSATKILSFTRNMRQVGLIPSTKLLDSEIIQSDVSTTIAGRVYSIKKPVCKITRLRFADEMPMMIEERFISLEFCPDIHKENLEVSLYDIYKNIYNLQISRINQSIKAIIIRDELKGYFQAKKSIPGFRVNGVTFCGKELILEIEESIYRGDRYEFTVEATP